MQKLSVKKTDGLSSCVQYYNMIIAKCENIEREDESIGKALIL